MSPEVRAGKGDLSSDMFSMAAIIYYLAETAYGIKNNEDWGEREEK